MNTKEKLCNKCGDTKLFDQFYKCATSKDGFQSHCKECQNVHTHEWRIANPEEIKAHKNKYDDTNREKVKTAKAKHYAANAGKIKVKRAKPEVRAQIAAQKRKRYASDAAYKLASLLRNRLNSAIKRKSKRGSAVELLGCSIDELLIRLESQFTEGMTWANHGEWHIDHKLPLCSFDLEDPAQLAIVCHYSNLQPLWATDNLSKSGERG